MTAPHRHLSRPAARRPREASAAAAARASCPASASGAGPSCRPRPVLPPLRPAGRPAGAAPARHRAHGLALRRRALRLLVGAIVYKVAAEQPAPAVPDMANAGRRRASPPAPAGGPGARHQPDDPAGALRPAVQPDHEAAEQRRQRRGRSGSPRWRSAPTASSTRRRRRPLPRGRAPPAGGRRRRRRRAGRHDPGRDARPPLRLHHPGHAAESPATARALAPGASSDFAGRLRRPRAPAAKPEYLDHRPVLDEFKRNAERRGPMTRTIHVAHSPDSDDAFMFYALAEGKIDTGDLRYVHELSRHRDAEPAGPAGGARGHGGLDPRLRPPLAATTRCSAPAPPWATATAPGWWPRGPRPADPRAALRGLRVAVPGLLTTAYLALKLYQPDFEAVVIPFDQIEDAVHAARSTSAS